MLQAETSNRTSVELKHAKKNRDEKLEEASNRTSVELKLFSGNHAGLYEPYSSNRTSVELKHDLDVVVDAEYDEASNRTSVELKRLPAEAPRVLSPF